MEILNGVNPLIENPNEVYHDNTLYGKGTKEVPLRVVSTGSGANTGDVTLAGTPDYITIAGQVITRNAVDLASDITGTLPIAQGGTGLSTLGLATQQLRVNAGANALEYFTPSAGGLPYYTYSVLLRQSGTSAPTAVTLLDTLSAYWGVTLSWSYSSIGVYRLNASSVVATNGKFAVVPMGGVQGNTGGNRLIHAYRQGSASSTNVAHLEVYVDAVATNAQMYDDLFEIRVYP